MTPDIAPLFPSAGGSVIASSPTGSSMPIVPSNLSPPDPNSVQSPSGSVAHCSPTLLAFGLPVKVSVAAVTGLLTWFLI